MNTHLAAQPAPVGERCVYCDCDDGSCNYRSQQAPTAAVPSQDVEVGLVEALLAEIKRLRPTHRSIFMSDVGRRDILDHFEHFLRARAEQRETPGMAVWEIGAADEAQMALCQLDWIAQDPDVHPHRLECIRKALERLASDGG